MTTWDVIVSNALGSAGAGLLSRLLTHPLDTIKARLQADGGKYGGPIDAFRRTYKIEGFRGLYRGFRYVICSEEMNTTNDHDYLNAELQAP